MSEQIVFPIGPNAQTIVDDNKDAKSLDEVDQKLTIMGLAHNRSTGTLNSGEIPEDFFNVIQTKKSDQCFLHQIRVQRRIFRGKGEEARPLEGEAAANAARQLLRAERVKAETGMASFSANLDAKYEGEYAAIMGKSGEPEKN